MRIIGLERSRSFFVDLGVGGGGIDAKHPENGFFFIAPVTSGIYSDCRKFASFTPALDGEGGNTEDLGNF